MDRSLFKFIWRYSKAQQITTLALILASFPFLYFSLDLPKTIVNEAIGGAADYFVLFSFNLFGFQFDGIEMGQLEYLFALCLIFLLMVCINGGFKLRINTYKGVMAERLLRRIRYLLLERTLRFPLSQFQKTSAGEVVTMVTAEVEPLGGFFGDAYALLAFQGGTFITIMTFMFIQDPLLGLAAFISIPVQGYVIPKLQKKVNALGKERVKYVRSLSNRINEVVAGVEDIHAQNHSKFILADMSDRLGKIFWVRFDIYKRKFFMKFLNNFIGQMTPFFFYSVGGYLVITGDLTFGALVAALAAYKDLAAPWKELLNYYQRMADSKIKYEQIHSQFVPEGMLEADKFDGRPEHEITLNGDLKATSLTVQDEDVMLIDNATFTLKKGSANLVTSNSGSSRDSLSRLLTRLQSPSKGSITVDGNEFSSLHEETIGQNIAYLSASPSFFDRSIADNLFMGLQQLPPKEESHDEERLKGIVESIAAGNSKDNITLDWINYPLANSNDYEDLRHQSVEILEQVELSNDLFNLGLRQVIDVNCNRDFADNLMKARQALWPYLEERGISDLVKPYNFDSYNEYTTVHENILFGRPIHERFNDVNFMQQPEIIKLLEKHNLYNMFLTIGLRSAEIMVDMFKDVTPGHTFFEQFSFVDEENLPVLKNIVAKAKNTEIDDLGKEDKDILLSLPLRLVPQRHRLGLIDNRFRSKLVELRKDIWEEYREFFVHDIQGFDSDHYNENLSIQDNILFGSIAFGRADATSKIEEALISITDQLNLREPVIRAAFGFNVGIGGARLSAAQRQKLALARNILKKPNILVINDGLNALDAKTRERICKELPQLTDNATTVWISTSEPEGFDYDTHYEIKNGKIALIDGSTPLQEEEIIQTQNMGEEAMVLQSLPLFSELEPSQLKLLAFTAERKHYLEGENLFRQGDEGDTAYVILDGAANVILEDEDGSESILFSLGRNKLVGELALLCDTRRTATVRAIKDLNALQLNSDVFAELARQDANFSYQMTRDLSQRLVDTTAELNAKSNGDSNK
ncbi:ABC transporter transmembrane domain-containing protein [Curvivirga sp.]|uniref:ABC transporter transmembrane domain-containing protein n=1 Tax=Curvivirga sp. TaxID=2856848 RepID=UPI003B5A17DD